MQALYANETQISDFSVLAKIISLKTLHIERAKIFNLLFVTSLKNLEELNLYGCKNVSDISSIERLTKLEVLNLENIGKKDNDFTSLGQLYSLKELKLGPGLASVAVTLLEAASEKRKQNIQQSFIANSAATIPSEKVTSDKNQKLQEIVSNPNFQKQLSELYIRYGIPIDQHFPLPEALRITADALNNALISPQIYSMHGKSL